MPCVTLAAKPSASAPARQLPRVRLCTMEYGPAHLRKGVTMAHHQFPGPAGLPAAWLAPRRHLEQMWPLDQLHSTSVLAQGHICCVGMTLLSSSDPSTAACATTAEQVGLWAGGHALGSSEATRSGAGQYPFTVVLSSFLSIALKCRMSCGRAAGARVPAQAGSQLYCTVKHANWLRGTSVCQTQQTCAS